MLNTVSAITPSISRPAARFGWVNRTNGLTSHIIQDALRQNGYRAELMIIEPLHRSYRPDGPLPESLPSQRFFSDQ